MAKLLIGLLMVWGAGYERATASEPDGPAGTSLLHRIAAPPAKPDPEQTPPPQPLTCSLRTPEGPRGGRLEVEGEGFGKAPLVRIAGKVTRMIERTDTRIAVQIPRDSDGGPVTVQAGELRVECGTLKIIGKN